nr:beta-propeller domain-containing protein [Candidatus Njordarchaeum guaymaensis]
MEKETIRRAKLYGVAAVLLAILLVSVCYQFGYIPQVSIPSTSAMPTFSSYGELYDYLKKDSQPQGWCPYSDSSGNVVIFMSPGMRTLGPEGVAQDLGFSNFASSYSKVQHSATNIQVSGVDEADVVKVDDYGYIYKITGNNITILKAYPPGEAEIVSILT